MILDGKDLSEFIKQRHYMTVMSLVPHVPKLAVVHASSDPATGSYLQAKQSYAEDIGVEIEIHQPKPATTEIVQLLQKLNKKSDVDGIIVQLPLPEDVNTQKVLAAIAANKDVDGLGPKSKFDPATPTGILWLLASYLIDYKDKSVLVIGQGRLVGEPLADMLEGSGAKVERADIETKNLANKVAAADIVITATGQSDLVTGEMVHADQVIIDASGDVSRDLYDRDDIKITPTPGGVGPMTVAALFDNLLRAAQMGK